MLICLGWIANGWKSTLYVELLDELRAKRRLPEMSDFQTYKQNA